MVSNNNQNIRGYETLCSTREQHFNGIFFFSDKVKAIEGPTGKTLGAINHANRVTRKLRRRLTRRTLAEAKALKEQGAEAIHVLVYVAELVNYLYTYNNNYKIVNNKK